jgi:predicted GH43/DUF377 family glycosyl hydrolase
VQHVSVLDHVVEDPLDGQVVPPPSPVEVDGEEEYQVSSVEDSRIYRNQLQYLVRWTGYDSLTWRQRSLLTGCKQWENSINDIQGNPDQWTMLAEDLEPKGGILSRRWKVRTYLEIVGGRSR